MKQFTLSLISLSSLTLVFNIGCIEGGESGGSPNSEGQESEDMGEVDQPSLVDMESDEVNDLCVGDETCDLGQPLECDISSDQVDCDDPLCSEDPRCLINPACQDDQVIDLELAETYTGAVNPTNDRERGSCGGEGPEAIFRFSPPEDGSYCITTVGSEGDTVLYLRRECDDAESEVSCNDDQEGMQAALTIGLEASDRYFLVVDHFRREGVGEISVVVKRGSCEEESPARPQEDCASEGDENENGLSECDDRACLNEPQCAQPIAPVTCEEEALLELNEWGSVTGNTEGATDEIHGSCGGQASGEQIYRFTPPVDGPFCVSTQGSLFDTLLHVRKTCADPQSEMACNDDYVHTRAALTVEGRAINSYYVIVDGYRHEGEYTLMISEGECPPAPEEICDQEGDEDFDGREGCEDFDCRFAESCLTDIPSACELDMMRDLSLGEVVSGSSMGAPMDLRGRCAGNGPEVVYRFIAPDDGDYCVTSAGSEYDTVLYVRSQCFQPDSELGCNDDFNNIAATLSLRGEMGIEYFIILDSFRDEGGDYTLTINEGPCIADNERCSLPGDEDGNGLEDCDDPACVDLPECAPPAACFDNELIPLSRLGEVSGQLPNRPSEVRGSCGGGGAEEVYTFSIAGDSPICLSAQGVGVDPVLYVRTDCEEPESEVACNDDYIGLDAALSLNAEADVTYYLYVDSYNGSGEYTLDMSVGECPLPTYPERCDREGDEDGNGLADCDDPACSEELSCLTPIGALACDESALIVLEESPYLGDTLGLLVAKRGVVVAHLPKSLTPSLRTAVALSARGLSSLILMPASMLGRHVPSLRVSWGAWRTKRAVTLSL